MEILKHWKGHCISAFGFLKKRASGNKLKDIEACDYDDKIFCLGEGTSKLSGISNGQESVGNQHENDSFIEKDNVLHLAEDAEKSSINKTVMNQPVAQSLSSFSRRNCDSVKKVQQKSQVSLLLLELSDDKNSSQPKESTSVPINDVNASFNEDEIFAEISSHKKVLTFDSPEVEEIKVYKSCLKSCLDIPEERNDIRKSNNSSYNDISRDITLCPESKLFQDKAIPSYCSSENRILKTQDFQESSRSEEMKYSSQKGVLKSSVSVTGTCSLDESDFETKAFRNDDTVGTSFEGGQLGKGSQNLKNGIKLLSSLASQSPYKILCFYNQAGMLRTIAGKNHIDFNISGQPVSLPISVDGNCYMKAESFQVVWRGNAALPLSEMKDGTEVMFDAVLSSDLKRFHTVIIWYHKKPEWIPLTLENLYLFVSSRSLPFTTSLLSANNDHLKIAYDNERVDASLSRDSVQYIKKLNKNGNYFVRINKIIKSGKKGCIEYFCDYIWDGSQQIHKRQTMQKLEVYKKVSSAKFASIENSSSLHFDVPGTIEHRDCNYILKYDYNGQQICKVMPPEILSVIAISNRHVVPVKFHLENCQKLGTRNVIFLNLTDLRISFFFLDHHVTVPFQQTIPLHTSNLTTDRIKTCTNSKASNQLRIKKVLSSSKVPKKSNSILEGVTGHYLRIEGDYMFLYLRNKFDAEPYDIVAVHHSVSFVNGKPLSEKCFLLLLKKKWSPVWYCEIEVYEKVIHDIYVKYTAKLAWQGKKPRSIDVFSLMKTNPYHSIKHEQMSSQAEEFVLNNEALDLDFMDLYPTVSASDEKELVEVLP